MFWIIGYLNLLYHVCTKYIVKMDKYYEWQNYKLEYGFNFTEVEEIEFKATFYKNLRYINEHNAKNSGFCIGINKLAHLKNPNQNGCVIISNRTDAEELDNQTIKLPKRPYPKSIDWRVNGHVSLIKDQFFCGACYVFGSVAAIESHISIHYGRKAVSLSEQEIVDCAGNYNTNHCFGGSPVGVFKYVIENGISTREEYPYWSYTGKCVKNKTKHRYKIEGYKLLPAEDEEALVRTIAFHGPVAMAINGHHPSFAFYRSGVYKNDYCDPHSLSHVVLAVGYHLGDDPYIIIKNSWNTWWGEGGYGKIALFRKNQCGISSYAMIPIVKL